ncbi:hypothetical protein PoB_000216500 [Plakobranchus ocellatus]|uniref:C3H1-type domain-containing protein n=1 Tax=Plakobranchus ocellatus TaxID=259542 RepID=A0AAV3XYF7_9GAST|nr:hypothetical protein PoB_000216500 [Plakobranchus ocellatus]
MKLPLAVEAKVADELRTWLASELEQLNDASSTNQFAHHVVTILLHEDLDIEDEPLSSPGDDFLKDIFSIRQTKTREKQKKEAVEFLRSAVCSEDPVDANIQMVVEELMQKIDATKSKLQNRKLSKRSLLTPLAINVDSSVKKVDVRNGAGEELYNEAFPSLSSEEPQSKGATVAATTPMAWIKSPGSGKENQKKRVRRRIGSRCTLLFRSPEEAQACDIATETAAVVLEDLSFSTKEAMEVWAPSHINSTPFTEPPMFCWKSAFSKKNFMTRPFSPSTAPLKLQQPTKCMRDVKEILPVILGDKSYKTHPECPHIDRIFNWEEMGFVPISQKTKLKSSDQRKVKVRAPKEPMDSDSEVSFYLCRDKDKEENRANHQDYAKNEEASFQEEIEGSASFPTHYGSYWQNLISEGAISLYPSFVPEMGEHNPKKNIWTALSQDQGSLFKNDDMSQSKAQKRLTERKRFEMCSRNIPDLCNNSENGQISMLLGKDLEGTFNMDVGDFNESACTNRVGMMHSTETKLVPEYGKVMHTSKPGKLPKQRLQTGNHEAWNSPWHPTEWDDINQDILAGFMGTKKETHNPYLPPQLASCVTSKDSQFLQSAFVNAFFSKPHLDDVYSQAWKPLSTHQQTSDSQTLEEHQFIRPRERPVELIKGSTCSNWLENNCKLGLLCPFSHPSV